MHQNPRNLALQCDLLALSAMLEAARGGEGSHEYALQAARLQSLSRDMQAREKQVRPVNRADDPLQQLEQRLSMTALRQHDLATLARDIETRARRDTSALQFEDVESRVVVYSKHRAQELRAQLGQVEESRQLLQAQIARDREELAAAADAIKRELSDRRAQSKTEPGRDR